MMPFGGQGSNSGKALFGVSFSCLGLLLELGDILQGRIPILALCHPIYSPELSHHSACHLQVEFLTGDGASHGGRWRPRLFVPIL